MDEKLKTEIEQMTKELVTRCICRYQQEISKLAECEGFECDNLIRQAHCEPHIMYKLRNADGSLSIVKDGREYVFLVEFDPDDFAYGIYFGCRCTLNEGSDIARQVHICNKEWESIRSEVISNLNNTFVDMDFAKRDLPTDNVSNGTYWPFWFRLGDDEGVIEIAALATRIIRNTYRWFFEEANYQRLMSGCSLPKLKCGRKKDATIRTRYTQTQYDSIVECLKNVKKYSKNNKVLWNMLFQF